MLFINSNIKEVISLTYYKLIQDNTFIGVANSQDFRVFQKKHQILLACSEEIANYVSCNETLYRDSWMVPVESIKFPYEYAQVIKIDKDEYDILLSTIEKNEEVIIEPEPEEEITTIAPTPDITIDFIKSSKIAEMSSICGSTIEAGVDVVLSDGEIKHFSYTTQDQLNLITLSAMIESGETALPYHADGELCRFYSVEDINLIINTATKHKTYHITYFNSLKAYINSLNSIEDISNIFYGVAIPINYQSEILQTMTTM